MCHRVSEFVSAARHSPSIHFQSGAENQTVPTPTTIKTIANTVCEENPSIYASSGSDTNTKANKAAGNEAALARAHFRTGNIPPNSIRSVPNSWMRF
jgi:hypothetical protein